MLLCGLGLLAAPVAGHATLLQTTAPLAASDPQSGAQQEPAPSQKVQGSQVENQPAYNQKPKVQPQQPQEPAPSVHITDGPPAETPLPPAPALPAPPPPPYQQDAGMPAMPPYKPTPTEFVVSQFGSTYIPLDSWINQAVLRLYSLGYVDTAFLGIRPWTRLSVEHMLARCADKLDEHEDDESEGATNL